MNITKAVIVCCILHLPAMGSGQVISTADTTIATKRNFDPELVQQLKEDPDLDYGQGPAAISLWQRFVQWLNQVIGRLLQIGMSTNWMNVLIAILAIIFLAYVVFRILRIDALKVFHSGTDRSTKGPMLLTENIHEMDFDRLIREAIEKDDYRTATRMVFLLALRLLAESQYVHWLPGKTNHDYLHEITGTPLYPGFRQLNRYFEYAWYGHFDITPGAFNKVNSVFSEWRDGIK